MKLARLLVAGTLSGVLLALPGAGHADTICSFGGPAPGFRAARIDLQAPSDFLVLRITTARAPRLLNDSNSWHLAQGILVLDANTLDIEAYLIQYQGTASPTAVVEIDGETVSRTAVSAPEGPFLHDNRNPRGSLPAGSYYVVAFGIGGAASGSTPQWWQASINVDGVHTCTQSAAGETFDIDQTQMSGGTQVHAPGVGAAQGISKRYTTSRPIVVGLVESAVQGPAGDVETCLTVPATVSAGCIGKDIVPFAGRAGTYEITSDYQGAFPIVAMTGAALEVPA